MHSRRMRMIGHSRPNNPLATTGIITWDTPPRCRSGAPIRRPRPQSSSAGSQSLWLIPPISGVRTSPFASVGERSRETPIYQGIRCDSYNGVEVMRLCSNPSWPR